MTDRDVLLILLSSLSGWWTCIVVLSGIDRALKRGEQPRVGLKAALGAIMAWHVYAVAFVLRLAYEAAR